MFSRLSSLTLLLALLVSPSHAARIQVGSDTNVSLDVGLRLQTWLGWTENAATDGSDLAEASIRRAYVYFNGRVHPRVGYFAHLAGDRIGQSNITANTGNGLGNGLAVRDAWTELDVLPGANAPLARLQVGRMYVPFFRQMGTTATFTFATIDAPSFEQGGFLPGRRVARDDGAVLWGNIFGGHLQYRAGVFDGSDNAGNGDVRTTARVVWYPWESENSWWNQGTYLDGKKVFGLGAAYDHLPNFSGTLDHDAWIVDAFFNHAFLGGVATLEGGYSEVDQDRTRFTGDYAYGHAAYLFPGERLGGKQQIYGRYSHFNLDPGVTVAVNAEEREIGGGITHYLFGLGNRAKITADWTRSLQQAGREIDRATLQFQVSF